MKEYQKFLDEIQINQRYRSSSEAYLEKYWLDKQELHETWLPIKDRIFTDDSEKRYPDKLFNENYDLIFSRGGILFYEKDFVLLQACMKALGEKYFIILEDYDEENPPHTSGPPYRLKYPVDVTWTMMISDKIISMDVYEMPIRNYYVFGDSGRWGKYAGNDYMAPLDIIGFQKSLSDLFRNESKLPEEDIEYIREWSASLGMKFPDAD